MKLSLPPLWLMESLHLGAECPDLALAVSGLSSPQRAWSWMPWPGLRASSVSRKPGFWWWEMGFLSGVGALLLPYCYCPGLFRGQLSEVHICLERKMPGEVIVGSSLGSGPLGFPVEPLHARSLKDTGDGTVTLPSTHS